MRSTLDEHYGPAIVLGLRRHGIEVTTEAEAGLLRAADEEHVADALNSQGYLGGVQPRRDGEPGPIHLSLGTTRGRAALTARR